MAHTESIDALMARASNADNFVSIDAFGAAARELRERLESGEMPSDIYLAGSLARQMRQTFDARKSRVC